MVSRPLSDKVHNSLKEVSEVRDAVKKFTDLFSILVVERHIGQSVVVNYPINKADTSKILNNDHMCCFCETKVDKSGAKKSNEENFSILSCANFRAIYVVCCKREICIARMKLLKLELKETSDRIKGKPFVKSKSDGDGAGTFMKGTISDFLCEFGPDGKLKWGVVSLDEQCVSFAEKADGTFDVRKSKWSNEQEY